MSEPDLVAMCDSSQTASKRRARGLERAVLLLFLVAYVAALLLGLWMAASAALDLGLAGISAAVAHLAEVNLR